MNMLAVISGDALIHAIVWIIVAGLIFWLLNWLISYVGLPEPFNKVAKVILVVVAVLFLINVLLSIAGKPLVRFGKVEHEPSPHHIFTVFNK